jgi:4-amino-4-deoxy-L-arabinose transferase-like glycosyltransferase
MASSTAKPSEQATPRVLRQTVPWLPLGYGLIVALLLFRLAYIASGTIELSKDEAYQWLWSKHLALSYYSKPPGIALIQFAGTSIWGDTQFGVRFFSPVFAAILSLVMLRFMARQAGPRQAFLLLVILSCVPLMGIGTILMTIDPPLVMFWMFSLVAGWRAVQANGKILHWLLAGLATGLGFLCKYNAMYLIVCWTLFFALWKPARIHLRKPGPYMALLMIALCTIPVIVWNSQHGWITAHHVADNAALKKNWKPTTAEFTGIEFAMLNPVIFVGMIWAALAFWRRRQEQPLMLFFFCMGAPVFAGHWLYSLHSRVQPNWIAPSIVPLCSLMLLYWDARWREGQVMVKRWFITAVIVGVAMLAPMHDTRMLMKLFGPQAPGELDPLRRVRAWSETAATVETARKKLASEGPPAFIIADHYGMAGEFSFYIPEARNTVKEMPLVYSVSSAEPRNQLFFWPEYRYTQTRKGQNAIYVTELNPYSLEKGWIWKWLKGKKPTYAQQQEAPPNAPPQIYQHFESVADLGVYEIRRDNRTLRRVRLFECRNLRAE